MAGPWLIAGCVLWPLAAVLMLTTNYLVRQALRAAEADPTRRDRFDPSADATPLAAVSASTSSGTNDAGGVPRHAASETASVLQLKILDVRWIWSIESAWDFFAQLGQVGRESLQTVYSHRALSDAYLPWAYCGAYVAALALVWPVTTPGTQQSPASMYLYLFLPRIRLFVFCFCFPLPLASGEWLRFSEHL
jgi:hypothetical protein